MLTPRVQVVLEGPKDLPVGTPADYQVVVRNDDRIDLEGLMLRLEVPKGVKVAKRQPSIGSVDFERQQDGSSMLTWQFEKLASGQRATAPVQFIAQDPRNFAVAMEWTLMPVFGDTNVSVKAPRLELALEGPSEVKYGIPHTYRLHLRNAGDAPAENVVVNLTAEAYGSSSSEIGTIEAGKQETVDIELTFNQKGTIKIAAAANATGNLASNTAINVLVRKPELTAFIQAPQLVYHGNATKYLVQIRNSGDANADNLRASLELPAGATPASVPKGALLNGQVINWPVSNLPAGEAKQFEFYVNLKAEGQNVVKLSCFDGAGGVASANTSTLVQAVADLKLFVSDPVAPAPVGSEVVYELQITNRGSKAARDVRVIAQFSEGIEPNRGEGHSHRVMPGQVYFDPISAIGAGKTVKLKVAALAARGGTHRFRVEVRSAETEVKLVQEESTQYLETASRIAAPPNANMIR